jgi:hypothetical protein
LRDLAAKLSPLALRAVDDMHARFGAVVSSPEMP